MNWFLLNMPLAAVFFGAWVGIPQWMTVKRPDMQPDFSAAHAHLNAKAALAGDKQPAMVFAA